MHRTLIVARMAEGSGPAVAGLFAASDATALPARVGVRSRTLFRYQDLYFHLIEADGEVRPRVDELRADPLFRRLSDDLDAHITPYDPATWRSPADAMATSFYHWESS